MSVVTDVCNFLGAGGIWGIAWDGWSALATAAATIVALAVPTSLARKEWGRQEGIREQERVDREAARTSAIREVCSAVDQILAYHEISIALAKGAFPFWLAFHAFCRIKENTLTLVDVLSILVHRPELTDGAIFSATAIKRVAKVVLENAASPQDEGNWPGRVARLESETPLANIVSRRVQGVRQQAGLTPSTAAQAIRNKYIPIVAEMARALAAQEAPNVPDIDTDHY